MQTIAQRKVYDAYLVAEQYGAVANQTNRQRDLDLDLIYFITRNETRMK